MAGRIPQMKSHQPSRRPSGARRALGMEPLETRALLAQFPLPLDPVEPVGSTIYAGSLQDVHGVDGPTEDFESGELGPQWSTSSSQPGGGVHLGDELGTAGGSHALVMEYDQFLGAQDLDAASWSRSADPNIANSQTRPHVSIEGTGDNTFDYYRFTVANAGAVGVFDIDATDSLDSYLRLYDASGTIVAQNDDSSTSSGAGGSQSGLDSFLQFTFPAAGEYVIEVGSCCGGNPVFSGGSYTLHVSLDDHAFEEGAGQISEVEPNQGVDNLNEAIWTVDLSNITDALLTFSYSDSGDSPDPFQGSFQGSFNADGLAISDDGVHWHPIFTPFFQTFGAWQEQVVDLSGEAAAAGLELGPDFQIKFQHYGDGSSRAWDDISLLVTGADTDSYEIAVEPGQLLTVAVAPFLGAFQPTVEIFAVSGDEMQLEAVATAPSPGQGAVIQTLATRDGVENYRIDIRGAAGVGTYGVQLAINAALEEESHAGVDNGSRDEAQELNPGWIMPSLDSPANLARTAAIGRIGLTPSDLEDFYSVHLEAGDTATATLNTRFGGSVDLALHDAVGTTLATGAVGTATNVDRSIVDFVAPVSGTYYFQVTGDEAAEYDLLVVRNAGFELERNSTRDQAYPVSGPQPGSSRWMIGARNPADDFPLVTDAEPNHPAPFGQLDFAQNIDETGWTRAFDANIADSETRPHVSIHGTGNNTLDYYSFTVANAGDVGIFDIDATVSLDAYLRLYNADGTVLAQNDDSSTSSGAGGSQSGLDSYLEFTFPEAGQYVIEVGSCCSPNPVGFGGRYILQISLDNHSLSYDIRPGRDIEPNHPGEPDLVSAAQNVDEEQWTIAQSEYIDGSTSIPHISIAGTGDGTFDYYSFNVQSAGAFGIFDIDFENFNTQLFLFDSQGNVLAENNDDGDDAGSESPSASYFTHRFSTPGTYIVGVGRFFSSAEGGEIVGTPPQAGNVYTLHISLRDRPGVPAADYYVLELTGNSSILVETRTPSAFPGEFANQFDPLVRIYDASGELLASDDNSATDGRNVRLPFAVPSDGTYYIEVAAASLLSEGEYLLGITNLDEVFLPGDYDGNHFVDQSDLDLVLTQWGRDPEQLPPQWVSNPPNGTIDQEELDAVLVNWGRMTGPTVAGVTPARPAPLAHGDRDCLELPPSLERDRAIDQTGILLAAGDSKPLLESVRRLPTLSSKLPTVARPPQPQLVSLVPSLPPTATGNKLAILSEDSQETSSRSHDLVLELLFGTTERLI